jgi:KaiC/GvpD/RAD55 family RecA-like ATPase
MKATGAKAPDLVAYCADIFRDAFDERALNGSRQHAEKLAATLFARLPGGEEQFLQFLNDQAADWRRLFRSKQAKGETVTPLAYTQILDDDRLRRWAEQHSVVLNDGGDVDPSQWPGIRARLASVPRGPRVATGITELDERLRGGLLPGKLMIVAGPPGSFKTGLLAQIGRAMAHGDVAVAILCADEEPAAVDVRNLQSIGVSREEAEAPSEETMDAAEREFGALPLEVLDGGSIGVEQAFIGLEKKYPDRQRAVLVDSLQTARTARTEGIDNPRQRVDDVVRTVKKLAGKTRSAAIATSEVSRGAYRSQKQDEQVSDLAAAKESGGIEYSADILLRLRNAEGEGNVVRVAIPKNRIGKRDDLVLKFDAERCGFENVSARQLDEDRQLLEDAKREGLRRRILATIEVGPVASKSVLHKKLGGRKVDVFDAIDELVTDGKVVIGDDTSRRVIRLVEGGPK